MQIISAKQVFTVSSSPIPHGIVVLDDHGVIRDVVDPHIEPDNALQLKSHELYKKLDDAIICPGFVSTHCHLELSHMRGEFTPGAGMAGFIKQILSTRSKYKQDEIDEAIVKGDEEMYRNGIVAVGDICNVADTFQVKSKSKIHYHSFVEVFDLDPSKSQIAFNTGLKLYEQLRKMNLAASIVPHAPYTVPPELYALVKEHAIKNNTIISCHNQESMAESEFYESNTGGLYDLFKNFGIDLSGFKRTRKNSFESTLPCFSNTNKTILVHNTFTSKEDIRLAQTYFNSSSHISHLISNISHLTSNIYFATCPNANLFIENALPNYSNFIDANAVVTIGTDSLASNYSLSILDEIKVIKKHNPSISIEMLLRWATINGACALGVESKFGSLEKGKAPGINALYGSDDQNVEDFKIEKLC